MATCKVKAGKPKAVKLTLRLDEAETLLSLLGNLTLSLSNEKEKEKTWAVRIKEDCDLTTLLKASGHTLYNVLDNELARFPEYFPEAIGE